MVPHGVSPAASCFTVVILVYGVSLTASRFTVVILVYGVSLTASRFSCDPGEPEGGPAPLYDRGV